MRVPATDLLLFIGMVTTVAFVAVIVLLDQGRSRRERSGT
jgi:hypothetical protein